MKAFDVRLNGKKLCVAGIGEDGVMSTLIDHVVRNGHNGLDLTVGGLLSPTDEHVTWKRLPLKVGDKVEVRIIEAAAVDSPEERFRRDSKQDERNSKAYVKALALKFGWKVLWRPKD